MRSHSSLAGKSHHVVISSNDIQRLRRLAYGNDEPISGRARTEKATLLKSISLDHIRKWESKSHTVKKAQREIREERQRRLDREEALRQAAERQAAIERAEREKYNNTDEVKSMLSGMMLADFAYENHRNENLRKERSEQEKRQTEKFLTNWRKDLERQTKDDLNREQARKEHDKRIAQTQKQQYAEYVKRKTEEREQIAAEGRRIAAENAKSVLEAEKKAQERMEFIREQKLQSLADNIRLKEIRDRERDKDKAEMARIAAYAADKERKEQMRREVAERRHRTRLMIKQRLIDIQSEDLRKRISNEDEMIAVRIQQNEAREERRRETEKTNQKAQKKMLDECRQKQISELQARRSEERRQAQELQAKWTRDKQAFDNEIEKQRRSERQSSIELQQFHQKQMNEKREREERQRHEMDSFVKESTAAHEKFVAELKRLTAATVQEYVRDGKDTLPIDLALAKNPSITSRVRRKLEHEDDDLRYMDEVSKCLTLY